jgi:hypothetical protein
MTENHTFPTILRKIFHIDKTRNIHQIRRSFLLWTDALFREQVLDIQKELQKAAILCTALRKVQVNTEGKVRPRTGHEGPEGE